MSEPPDEKEDSEEDDLAEEDFEDDVTDEELLQQMRPWHRALMVFLVVPLIKTYDFLEGFFRTKWRIIPLDELPAARQRWSSVSMTPEQVRDLIKRQDGFLCDECKMELKTQRQDAEELFPNVWEVRKHGRCEACGADREHCSRIHHGYLLFKEDGRWMAVFAQVPFLRRCWLRLRG
ncbi:MAG TPA: hypothetical protein DIT13_17055 [Verrucomicrobiales bacterium]|nr:hypothetical protein [Verrucomicrobiales bacterium]HRJ07357.1 hypothetical protein [Prosthecobacter sp.]HRK13552.1 hypothetical protein [Prosthecobacter sp.]